MCYKWNELGFICKWINEKCPNETKGRLQLLIIMLFEKHHKLFLWPLGLAFLSFSFVYIQGSSGDTGVTKKMLWCYLRFSPVMFFLCLKAEFMPISNDTWSALRIIFYHFQSFWKFLAAFSFLFCDPFSKLKEACNHIVDLLSAYGGT